MTVVEIAYKPHEKQKLFHKSSARFKLLVAGRRSGKTVAGANECIKFAITNNGCKGLVCAPTYKQAEIGYNKIREYLPHNLIYSYTRNNKEWSITLLNGSKIHFATLKMADNLRGQDFDFVWIDEVAFIKKTDWELVLRPMLMDRQGKAWFTTTPVLGTWVRELFVKGQTPMEEQGRSKFYSLMYGSMSNPYLDKDEVSEMSEHLSKNGYRQEVLGQFVDDAGQIFSNIEACYKSYVKPTINYRELVYAGVDLAKHEDYTVVIILDRRGALLEFHRWQKIDWPLQKKKIKNILGKYSSALITMDSRGVGDPIYDDLLADGLQTLFPFNFNSFREKKALIDSLVISVENKQVSIPNEPVLVNELVMFGFEKSNGTVAYEAPPGYNDDCVIALALANWRYRGSIGSQNLTPIFS